MFATEKAIPTLLVDVINKHTICQLKNIFLSQAESREIDCDETI